MMGETADARSSFSICVLPRWCADQPTQTPEPVSWVSEEGGRLAVWDGEE